MAESAASKAQIEANRANAQRSTGPRTDQGKAISSQNAITHGRSSRVLVMPDESVAKFDQLSNELLQSYGVRNDAERLIVEQIILAHWRPRRVRRLERKVYDYWAKGELEMKQKQYRGQDLTPADVESADIHRVSGRCAQLAQIEGYEDRLYSLIARAHRELERMRKIAKLQAPEDEPREPRAAGPEASDPRNEAILRATDDMTGAYGEPAAAERVEPVPAGTAQATRLSAETVQVTEPEPDLRL